MNTILIVVCVALSLAFLVLILAVLAAALWWMRRLLSQAVMVAESMAQFHRSIAKLSEVADALAKTPEYMRGHARAAEATALQIGRLTQTVQQFSSMLIDPRASKNSLSVPTEEEKERYFTVQELMAGGMTLQDAETAANNEQMRRGALTLGVD